MELEGEVLFFSWYLLLLILYHLQASEQAFTLVKEDLLVLGMCFAFPAENMGKVTTR